MTEVFKTILLQTASGSIVVITLSILMELFGKRISGSVQKFLWILALISMLIPLWRFIPGDYAEKMIIQYNIDYYLNHTDVQPSAGTDFDSSGHYPAEEGKISIMTVTAPLWLSGTVIFMLLNVFGYIIFIIRKRHNSVNAEDADLFEEVKNNMGINRKIRLRKCNDFDSPFLTGVIFPIVYVPDDITGSASERLIYLHELTHYKHKDLLIKWISCFVNAVHWFNPFCYVITRNIRNSCEISCDAAVTKNMTDNEKKMYMNAILNLVLKKGENNV